LKTQDIFARVKFEPWPYGFLDHLFRTNTDQVKGFFTQTSRQDTNKTMTCHALTTFYSPETIRKYSDMRNITKIFSLFILFGLAITNASCSTQDRSTNKAKSNYVKLCNIYTETIHKNLSSNMQAQEIVTRINQEVPDLYPLLEKISNADTKDVYSLYKQSAEFSSIKNWECPAIKTFYSP